MNNIIILIVAGGDKSDQKRLIKQAGKYLKELEERT
jgi:putative component of toxin-antitoxin plasmid stabilization module